MALALPLLQVAQAVQGAVHIKAYNWTNDLIAEVSVTPAFEWGTYTPAGIAVYTSEAFKRLEFRVSSGYLLPGSKIYTSCNDRVAFAKGKAQKPVLSPAPLQGNTSISAPQGGTVSFTSYDAEWVCHSTAPDKKARCGPTANTCSEGTSTAGGKGSQFFAPSETATYDLSVQGCSSKGHSAAVSGKYRFCCPLKK